MFRSRKPSDHQSSLQTFRLETSDGVRSVTFESGETFLEAIKRAEVEIDNSCGGMGSCGTCRVDIVAGGERFLAPGQLETEIFQDQKWKENRRLSCQNLAVTGVTLKIPND